MDERLVKQWEVTKTLLATAAAEVSDAQGISEYQEYIDYNELELALNALEAIGDGSAVSPDFWWNLKKAAEVMGLRSHYAALRSRRLKAARNAG